MSRLEITLSCILVLSTLLNIGVFVYARAVVVQLLSVSEELGDLQSMIDSFAAHAKGVYEMEMFYGDQTLENLLSHAKALAEEFTKYESVFDLTGETKDDSGAEEEAPPTQE